MAKKLARFTPNDKPANQTGSWRDFGFSISEMANHEIHEAHEKKIMKSAFAAIIPSLVD